jgi:hypothetical protein
MQIFTYTTTVAGASANMHRQLCGHCRFFFKNTHIYAEIEHEILCFFWLNVAASGLIEFH